jgi:hypothetical protein
MPHFVEDRESGQEAGALVAIVDVMARIVMHTVPDDVGTGIGVAKLRRKRKARLEKSESEGLPPF